MIFLGLLNILFSLPPSLPCLTLQRILDLELYLESFPSSEQSNSSKVFNPLVEITQKQEAHINLAVQIAVQKRKAGVADVDWLKNPAEEEMDMLVWIYYPCWRGYIK